MEKTNETSATRSLSPPYGGSAQQMWPAPSVNILPVQTAAFPTNGTMIQSQNQSSEFENLPVGTVIRKTGQKRWKELDDENLETNHSRHQVENEVLLKTLPKGTLLEKGDDGNWREVDDGSEDVAETLEQLPAGTFWFIRALAHFFELKNTKITFSLTSQKNLISVFTNTSI